MLDDLNVLAQKDPQNALDVVSEQPKQLDLELPELPQFKATQNIVLAGMGGSALAGLICKNWLSMKVPFEVTRGYQLPSYVNANTLVIAASYSGNTEETLAALAQAEAAHSQIVVMTAGGKLAVQAEQKGYPLLSVPADFQPRLAVWFALKQLAGLFDSAGFTTGAAADLLATKKLLSEAALEWGKEVPTEQNYAKQLAEKLMGKPVVVYGGPCLASAAYKWKIDINENAKTVAAWNELPEFNHNEFQGWVSHPVEKPFAVVELQSNLDHPQVQKRFEVSNKLLSGKMPHPIIINAKGESHIAQLLWAILLGDFVSVYLAILHGVNPTSVDLIEKLKQELA